MKKCRSCSKPATLHITEVQEDEVVEIHLCEICAKDYLSQADEEPSPEPNFEFDKLEDDESETIEDPIDNRLCPNCAISFREFRSQGRLGCPHCYIEFDAELIPLLENIHNETQHCGKLPRRAPDSSRRQHELVRLKNDLKSVVDQENYEEAAKIRDEIQTIEDELGGLQNP
jgi:protein arginine kinase activator